MKIKKKEARNRPYLKNLLTAELQEFLGMTIEHCKDIENYDKLGCDSDVTTK